MPVFQSGPDDLRRLCYRSRATRPLDAAEIGALVEGAASFNAERGITGALVSAGVGYQQWLEGPADALDDLMARLRHDPRHAEVTLLENAPVAERAFAGWHMQLFQTPGDLALSPLAMVLGSSTPPDARDWTTALALVTDGLAQRGAAPAMAPDEAEAIAAALVSPGNDGGLAERLAPALVAPAGRAAAYEAVARALGDGWMADRWSMSEVTVALGRFQSLLWQAPQAVDPVRPVGHAIVANLPGNPHFLGAVIKADLLRASGWSVSLMLDGEPDEIEAAARAAPGAPVLLAGSRLLAGLAEARMAELVGRLRAACPGTLVMTGGRGTHALSATAERLWARLQRARDHEKGAAERGLKSPALASAVGSRVH